VYIIDGVHISARLLDDIIILSAYKIRWISEYYTRANANELFMWIQMGHFACVKEDIILQYLRIQVYLTLCSHDMHKKNAQHKCHYTPGIAVVTGLKYPSRTAIQMLSELYTPYSEQFSLQAKAATNGALTKKSKSLLSEYCKKYDDSSKVDKASALNSKVEVVKGQMQDNIAAMLKNTEQAETLAERSNQLNEQANVFQKKSKDLRKQMRCKNIKMTIILSSLVIGILIIVLVPLIMRAKKAADGNRLLRGAFLEELENFEYEE